MRLGLAETISPLEGHDCSAGCSATVAPRCLLHLGFGIVGTAIDAPQECKVMFSRDLWGIRMTAGGIGGLLARQLQRRRSDVGCPPMPSRSGTRLTQPQSRRIDQ